jgi:hypothetical protein
MCQTAFVLPQTASLSTGFFQFYVIWLHYPKRFELSGSTNPMLAKEKPPPAAICPKSPRGGVFAKVST